MNVRHGYSYTIHPGYLRAPTTFINVQLQACNIENQPSLIRTLFRVALRGRPASVVVGTSALAFVSASAPFAADDDTVAFSSGWVAVSPVAVVALAFAASPPSVAFPPAPAQWLVQSSQQPLPSAL